MIEKVNPKHPDKLADRIAGAIVDKVYQNNKKDRVAVEVLVGHGHCHIIVETTSNVINNKTVKPIINRILEHEVKLDLKVYKQDPILSNNQSDKVRCGDNGIFKGLPLTEEEKQLSKLARIIYKKFPFDGKYILDDNRLIICQSNASEIAIKKIYPNSEVNPLGYWTGGIDVDTGCTNRKLGSDMAHAVTGGGLHGKDLSKADVSVNIYAFLKAQETGKKQEFSCAIGDEKIDNRPYHEIVEIAERFIDEIGGFEKFAEWGLF